MKQKIWGFPAHTNTGQKAVTVIAAFLAALLYMAFSSIQVHAAEGFNLYTDTPGIYVTAGDSVSFDLHLAGGNAAEKDVSLSVSSIFLSPLFTQIELCPGKLLQVFHLYKSHQP